MPAYRNCDQEHQIGVNPSQYTKPAAKTVKHYEHIYFRNTGVHTVCNIGCVLPPPWGPWDGGEVTHDKSFEYKGQ